MEFKFRAVDFDDNKPRRELAMERELGISIPRPHWSTSTVMNPVSVAHSGALSILPPPEINPSQEISDEGKVVIVLDKPDPNLFYAKRKATAPPVSEIEPLAFSLKKKRKEPKEKWSCALCEIKATNESGLNAHLNGKKHKAREARQNRKVTQSVVATTELAVDAEKNQQLLQPRTALEAMNETVVDKGVEEIKKEEQLVKMVAYDDTSAAESK